MGRRAGVVAMVVLVALATMVPVGCRQKSQPLGGEPPATPPTIPPAAAPATPEPVAKTDTTWVVSAPDIAVTSPGDYDLGTPTTLTIEFSAPVDQKSVEAALLDTFAKTTGGSGSMQVVWTGDRTATLNVSKIETDLPVRISPDGGLDANGRRLTGTVENFFAIHPGDPLSCWCYWPGQPDRPPEKIATLGQPYTVYSLSPTGDRMLLWLQAIPYVGVPGPLHPGRFYLLDLAKAELVALSQEDRWGKYSWLPDGTLVYRCLMLSPSPGGTSPSWLYTKPVADGPGGQAMRWVREFAGGETDRLFFSADGSKAAIVQESRAVVLNLSDQTTRTVDDISARACPSGYDDSRFVLASVSQDGRYLAYSDWTPVEGGDPVVRVWVADTGTGEKWPIADNIRGEFSWSPSGEAMLLRGKGIVDRTGQIIYPCAGEGRWSPSGKVLWLRDKGLVRVSDWTVLQEVTMNECGWYMQPFAWSPDGTKFAGYFSGRNLVVSSEGLVLWEDKGPSLTPFWSPDSSRLVVGSTVLGFDNGATPTVTAIDFSVTGFESRAVGWSADALIVVEGGRR